MARPGSPGPKRRCTGRSNRSGIDAHYYFEWGTDRDTATRLRLRPGTDAGSGPGVACRPRRRSAGLQLGTTYHYRLVATNADGTNYGQDQTLSTLEAVIGLETTAATDLTQTAATLNGKLDPDGLADQLLLRMGPDDQLREQHQRPARDVSRRRLGIGRLVGPD